LFYYEHEVVEFKEKFGNYYDTLKEIYGNNNITTKSGLNNVNLALNHLKKVFSSYFYETK